MFDNELSDLRQAKKEVIMILHLSDIRKKYRTKTALNDINLELSYGIHGLLGPNGAGKSTLMKIIVDLIKPTEGKVTIDGISIHKKGRDYRNIIGYLPQNPGFSNNFSGYEIMRYYAALKNVSAQREIIAQLLDFVNLSEDQNRKYGEYSGGMKRRLGIAVALLNNPQILILDEPTAGLDPKERIRFRNIISKISKNKIIIIATHIVSDIEDIADDVIFIKNGEIMLFSTTSDAVKSIKEKVWNINISESEIDKIEEQYPNSIVEKNAQGLSLHIVCDEKPFDEAYNVPPTLEDLYMYYFNETQDAGE